MFILSYLWPVECWIYSNTGSSPFVGDGNDVSTVICVSLSYWSCLYQWISLSFCSAQQLLFHEAFALASFQAWSVAYPQCCVVCVLFITPAQRKDVSTCKNECQTDKRTERGNSQKAGWKHAVHTDTINVTKGWDMSLSTLSPLLYFVLTR